MNFLIITHVVHKINSNEIFGYGPYIREMNIWAKYCTKFTVVAPIKKVDADKIDVAYNIKDIDFVKIKEFDILGFRSIIKTIFVLPKTFFILIRAMRKADHIHLRCPGNVGLLGCFVQIFFPSKPKTAKYAGNWDRNAKKPFTYKLQQMILSNTFLTRNMKVLVYGEWQNQTKNIVPFFTASYQQADYAKVIKKDFQNGIKIVFVGMLVSGKNPLYALEITNQLYKLGYAISIDFYGEGNQRKFLEQYILDNSLENIAVLKGNQPLENLKKAYQEAHFVILPSASEGWPKAVAEGMFWGCVPLATAVSCVPYMLDNGKRGVLIHQNLDEDTKKILLLLNNFDLFIEISDKATNWSKEFTTNKFEDAIAGLLKG